MSAGRRWGLLGAAAVVLAVVVFLVTRGGGAGEEGASDAPVVEAATAPVRVEDFPVTVAALGTVVPGPGAEARPAAPAPTRVTAVLVAPGDRVSAGQPLVRLDASVFGPQLAQAQAALASAQEAKSRAARLVEQGIAPRKELESADAELAQARAALAVARRNRDLATVRSPIEGVVTAVNVALGQPVDANQPLVDVVAPSGLSVVFRLSPADADRVRPGADVALTAAAPPAGRDAPARLGRGTVTGVSAAVDASTGSVEVRVLPDRPARQLRAGETVAGRITVGVDSGALVVPAASLVPGEGETHVFVVDADGIAHETAVVVGARSDTDAEIVSGLEGGETVVAEGAYGVTDGARIQRQGGPEGSDAPAAPGGGGTTAPDTPAASAGA